jgi:nucleotidyltransferase substrate binding protein (TIGR01987 family)
MPGTRVEQSLRSLGSALERLREALAEPETSSLAVDGTIQRFEFVIELFWKSLKRALEEEGIETRTPRESLQRAYQAGWLGDETAWLQMLRDRNETSHIYDEGAARRIYGHIRQYFPEMERTFAFLRRRFPPDR